MTIIKTALPFLALLISGCTPAPGSDLAKERQKELESSMRSFVVIKDTETGCEFLAFPHFPERGATPRMQRNPNGMMSQRGCK